MFVDNRSKDRTKDYVGGLRVSKKKLNKESVSIALILILSAILNFGNISIEGYGNEYYAAGVKSMTINLKNFFFVSFDPGSFVTIDKPPMGFWIQAIFAKIFGFSGWSILMPQALAGVISVYLTYYLVKKAFGNIAGYISALCLAVTPVFVAASRNNTIDNLLVMTLLFACVALTKAVENGKSKYLYISLLLVGIGFNIKMLEAYMIGPAIYITYLLSTTIPFKKKVGHLVISTVILVAVSLSWAVIVDLVPAQNRPYIGSSTNNSVMELIIGHNGLERLGLSGSTNKGDGNRQGQDSKEDGNNSGQMPQGTQDGNNQGGMAGGAPNGNAKGAPPKVPNGGNNGSDENNQRMQRTMEDGKRQDNSNMQQPPNGDMPSGDGMQNRGPGGKGGVQGSFGSQVKSGISRLFVKSSLSDQIVWFLPLAFLGFIAGAIKEKLRFKLDNKRKISLMLWITWLVPEFIYFSYTTGLFHPYYLTMMAPPAAALAGIGISSMWELYKEGKWKGWLLPTAFALTGLTHLRMMSYFSSNLSTITRNIILAALVLCFVASAILAALNLLTLTNKNNNINLDDIKNMRSKKIIATITTVSILVTPFIGASAAITHSVNSSIPVAGLELLSNGEKTFVKVPLSRENSVSSSKLINYLKSNKTTEKYLLVVSSSQSADSIIIQTGEPVMALGGFSNDKILTLDEFKEKVKNGEVRYVLSGGRGPGGSNEIMNWVTENGKVVPESEYKDINTETQLGNIKNTHIQDKTLEESNIKGSNSGKQNFGGNNSEILYDLKNLTETSN